jgi:CHAD domain-containing protein
MRAKVSCGIYGQKVLQRHLNHLMKQLVMFQKGRYVTAVHDLRTTSRRLRNAFWVFKKLLPKFPRQQWNNQIRRIASLCGEARDLDVSIQFLNSLLKNERFREVKRSLRVLLNHMKQERKEIQPHLFLLMSKVAGDQVYEKMLMSVNRLALDKRGEGYALDIVGRKKILKRLDDFLGYERYVNKPENSKKLHEMRIAAKHLRYTLELLRPFYGKGLERFIVPVYFIHRILGSMHDLDVRVDWLKQLKARKNDRLLHSATDDLIRKCKVLRSEDYQNFIKNWRQYHRQEIWDKLKSFIDLKIH